MRIVFLNVCVLSVHYQTYPSHDPQALGQLSLTNLNIEGNSAKLKHIKRNRHTTTNWERLKTLMALSLLYEWFTASLPDVGSSSEPCFSFMHQRFRRLRVNGPREHHCPRTLVESLIYHCNMNGTWEITQLARKSIVKWFRFDAVAPEDAKVLIDFGLTFGFFFFSRYQNSAFACVTTSLFYAHIIRLIHCVCVCVKRLCLCPHPRRFELVLQASLLSCPLIQLVTSLYFCPYTLTLTTSTRTFLLCAIFSPALGGLRRVLRNRDNVRELYEWVCGCVCISFGLSALTNERTRVCVQWRKTQSERTGKQFQIKCRLTRAKAP